MDKQQNEVTISVHGQFLGDMQISIATFFHFYSEEAGCTDLK